MLFFFSYCKNSNDTYTPKNNLGDAQMASLLTEIHLVEASVTPMLLQGDSATQYIVNNYNYLFQKYNTDQKGFRETMDYYVRHPKEMDKVYELVMENLSKMQSEIK